MKNTRFTSILNSSLVACALMIGSLGSTQLASAQMDPPLAEVNIPFAFQTPTRTLPAGIYRIHRKSDHLILLEGPGSVRGFVITHVAIQSHASNRGVIVFDRYGDKYFLHQIWTAGDEVGVECSKGRVESLEAKNKQPPSSTLLAFNSPPKH
jgi:hypothetical protein